MAVVNHKKGWQVRVRDPQGRFYPYKSFKKKVDAQRFERALQMRRDQGDRALPIEVRKASTDDFFVLWMSKCRSGVSDGWNSSVKQMYRDHISPIVGQRKFVDLRKNHIQSVMDSLLSKGLSAQMRLHIYNLLNKMFDDGIHHLEIIQVNPVLKSLKPTLIRKERNFLRSKDAWNLLNASRNEWFGPPIWLGILAAMRPCEVQALTWDAVDLDNSRILIKASYNRKERRIQSHTKQKDWGHAPITPALKDFLIELKTKSGGIGFVVVSPRGGGMMSYDSFCRALPRKCEELGITRVTPHELRHTATELYYEVGANTEDLKRLLNHSNVKTTETYIHRTHERLQRIADGICQPKSPLKAVK